MSRKKTPGGETEMSRYHEIYKSWQQDPESFWADAASDIHWHKPFDKVFDDKAGLTAAGSSAANATPLTIASTGTSSGDAETRPRSSTTVRLPERRDPSPSASFFTRSKPSPPSSPTKA